jgi:hypothetical protein
MEKVNKLYNTMKELGICIEYGGAGGLSVIDIQTDTIYKLKDSDTSEQLPYFPTGVEFKLTIDEY